MSGTTTVEFPTNSGTWRRNRAHDYISTRYALRNATTPELARALRYQLANIALAWAPGAQGGAAIIDLRVRWQMASGY